jgi:flagellar motor switch protein FliN/FliY
VIIPEPLYHAFKAHFAEVKPLSIPKETAKNIDVTLSLEAGNATLTLGQWKQIERGDFLVLDRCSFDPVGHKGIVTIALEKTPLLKAKIKDNQIKILDYALYFEENPDTTMSYPDEEEPHEEEFFSEEEDVSNEEHVGEDKEESPTSVEHSAMEKMISANEIPVTVAVEVARVRMNLEKLIELQPGNVLELGVMPDVGVDLTINGKKVARGELVKLGEVLGVKILNLGG